MSDKPTSRLLQLKPGGTLLAVDPPSDYLDLLGPLPNGARLVDDFSANPDVVLLFVASPERLETALASVLQAARRDATVWVSYPKAAARQARAGLSRQEVHNAFRRLGYKPVAQFSVDETWSAIRGRPA